MGGRGASSGSVNSISSNFMTKVMKANQGSPEELINELSKFNYKSDKEEKHYDSSTIKFKSAVMSNGTDEIFIRFGSDYTGKEINNSAGDKISTTITVYQRKNGKPLSYSTIYSKETKSLKNIQKNYEEGLKLYKKITKNK